MLVLNNGGDVNKLGFCLFALLFCCFDACVGAVLDVALAAKLPETLPLFAVANGIQYVIQGMSRKCNDSLKCPTGTTECSQFIQNMAGTTTKLLTVILLPTLRYVC